MKKKEPTAAELAALLREARGYLGVPGADTSEIARKIDEAFGPNPAPTPYEWDDRGDRILDADGEVIADVRGEDTGRFMVEACNAYEGLVEQVRAAAVGQVPERIRELAKGGYEHLVERWGKDDERLDEFARALEQIGFLTARPIRSAPPGAIGGPVYPPYVPPPPPGR